jgi:hypothetical protein
MYSLDTICKLYEMNFFFAFYFIVVVVIVVVVGGYAGFRV